MGDRELDRLRRDARAAVRGGRRAAPTPAAAAAAPKVRSRSSWLYPWAELRFREPTRALLVVVPGVTGGMLALGGLSAPHTALRLAAWLALATIVAATPAAVSMVRFHRWWTRLPYTLVGWDEIAAQAERGRQGERRPAFADRAWRRWMIEVVFAPQPTPSPSADDDPYRGVVATIGEDERPTLVQAAFTVFIARAHRRFYAASGDDPRVGWSVDGELRATGSANAGVTWEIARLCRGELAMLARKLGPFEVRLTADASELDVFERFR